MIRFKVIKASHLLLFFSVLVLIIVVSFLILNNYSQIGSSDTVGYKAESIEIASREAKAHEAFASLETSSFTLEVQPDKTPNTTKENEKKILIYHTHTHEAYEQETDKPYVAIEAWRTSDNDHNVVRVGEFLAQELEAHGHYVVHDTTDHELDSINESYIRSLKTLQSYETAFDLCIDLHRDAYVDGMKKNISFDNSEYAQVMLLVGRADNYPANEKPDYEHNLLFAQEVTNGLNESLPGICRNVTVKSGRYNQHFGTISALVEVGHNKNNLQEALNSIPPLAESIHRALTNCQ